MSSTSLPGVPSTRPSSRMTRPAARDLDLLVAGLAAEQGLEPGLDAGLADLEARDLEEGVGVLELGEVALGDRADVADDVGGVVAVGVDAAEADLGDDAGQDGRVRRDADDVVPGQVLGDDDGHEGAARHHLLQRARRGSSGGSGMISARRASTASRVAGLLADHDDAVVLAVAGDDRAVAVGDDAARRGDQADVDRGSPRRAGGSARSGRAGGRASARRGRRRRRPGCRAA